MRIVDIQERSIPIASEIRNAYINFNKMNVSLVALRTDVIRNGQPVVGYGFNSNGRYAQGALLRERFIPRLMEASPRDVSTDDGENLDPFKIWKILMTNEKPGGHGERSVAVGVIDMAVWDALAKIEGAPLHRLLAERYRGSQPEKEVSVYAAGGYYYPGKGLDALQAEMRGYLELGYRDVKMKIGGAALPDDLRRIEAVLEVVGEGSRLAVDANGRYELAEAMAVGRAIEPYKLKWFEEPGDPLDFALQAELGRHYRPPMATGENLFSHQDSRNLVRYAGMRPDRDILQMDPVLSYGLVEYLRTIEAIEQNGWSRRRCIPHGGHQFALNIAAGLGLGGNESYPGVFAPFGGFADSTPIRDGMVGLPELPGIGFEDKASIMDVIRAEFG
jgi:L-alanine-DL-glutamate epimerase-like enolase superfamily enzyme